ncbi:predicted protein, partial [Nematostella vectensis]
LGVNGGIIPDESITASSFSDDTHKPARARLDQDASGQQATSWCAKDNNREQWLQVDLESPLSIKRSKYNTRERDQQTQLKTQIFMASKHNVHSLKAWPVNTPLPKVFAGNTNGNETTCHELPYPLNVQYIRLRPVAWKNKICMRVGLFGE